jgi:hypothetical protein
MKMPLLPYIETLIDAFELYDVVDDLKKNKVNRLNKKRQAIYRNLIVNLCASFEVAMETILDTGIEFITKNAKSSSKIPTNVKLRISNSLIATKDERKIWEISDNGWKKHLKSNHSILKERFNTVRPHVIDEYFFKSIGIKNISESWSWNGQNSDKTSEILNEFMDLRGQITHRYNVNKIIYAKDIQRYLNLLHRIATCTSNEISNHIYNITKQHPWEKIKLVTIIHK